MNIFQNADGFIGTVPPESFGNSLKKFFDAASGVRDKLGNSHEFLAEYLEAVFDAISKTNTETAATCGFSRCTKELRTICNAIIRGSGEETQHPFYDTAKSYIEAHPIPYEESQSKLEFYTVALVGEFIKYAIAQHYNEFGGKLNDETARITALYNDICAVLGSEEPMERLNEIIQDEFITVPVMASFVQGIIDSTVLSMLFNEPGSGKFVFEMMEV